MILHFFVPTTKSRLKFPVGKVNIRSERAIFDRNLEFPMKMSGFGQNFNRIYVRNEIFDRKFHYCNRIWKLYEPFATAKY